MSKSTSKVKKPGKLDPSAEVLETCPTCESQVPAGRLVEMAERRTRQKAPTACLGCAECERRPYKIQIGRHAAVAAFSRIVDAHADAALAKVDNGVMVHVDEEGGVVQTDVVELLLRDPVADVAITDDTVCTSVAVALRQAAAEDLNIDPRELGWATSDSHGPDGRARAIVLFDMAEGGAGYVGSISHRLPRLLVRAREILSCDCDRACHKCLLSFDTQFAIERLDWRAGKTVITDALLGALELPSELRVFGAESRLECSPLLSALLTELRRPDSETCRVYLAGDTGDWDFGEWALWPHLVRAASEGRSVVVVVPGDRLAELPWDEANALASRSEGTGILIEVSAGHGVRVGDMWLALEVGGKNRSSRWACTGEEPLEPGAGWGSGGDAVTRVARGDASRALDASSTRAARAGELRKPKPGQFTEVLFRHELDGLVADTGAKFWGVLARAIPALQARLSGPSPLEELRYSDRYVVAPLEVRVLFEVLSALRGRAGGLASTTAVTVTVMEGKNERLPVRVDHNFPDASMQKDVLGRILRELGRVQVSVLPKHNTAHARELVLVWPDGQFMLRLDQGLGFLRSVGQASHPFSASAEKQAADLRAAAFRVALSSMGGVPAYFEGPIERRP
ncbi:MAG: Zn-binding domain-containing protein [Polyangiaceae bacterium]